LPFVDAKPAVFDFFENGGMWKLSMIDRQEPFHRRAGKTGEFLIFLLQMKRGYAIITTGCVRRKEEYCQKETKMKNILITGAYGGMGRAAVCRWKKLGWRVFALDREVGEAGGSS